MNRLVVVISFLLASNAQATNEEPNETQVKTFVNAYLKAIRNDDFSSLRNMSISKTNNHYVSAKKVLKTLNDNKYKLNVVPLSKNDNDVNFATALSGGNCGFVGTPTHKATIEWTSNKEEFYKGHKCHRLVQSSRQIIMALSSQNDVIKEHSNCKKNEQAQSRKIIKKENIPNEQKNTIKKWLKSQELFSNIKAYKYINSKYGYNYQDSQIIISAVCNEL